MKIIVLMKKIQKKNLSEVDSDDNIDEADTPTRESGKKNSTKKRKKPKRQVNDTKKQLDDKEENVNTAAATEDEEEDKSRADALWADFLSGTDPLPMKKAETKNVSTVETKVRDDTPPPEPKKETTKRLVTEIFDFAGEKVEVTKEVKEPVPSTNNEQSDIKSSGPSNGGIGRRPPFSGIKRPGGGIGSVLGQIAKKNKISVLDKSKLDWDSFKRNEGIDEQLQTFNKGKDGYLERQDFLDRTDVRQFELEKSIRLSKRNNRNY